MSRFTSPNRRRFLAAGAATLAGLAGCLGGSSRELPESPTGEWPQFAHDAGNTGTSPVSVPPRGNRAWDEGESTTASPVLGDGLVFVVGSGATAVDGRTGSEEWRTELSGRATEANHAPALDDDRLVVATNDAVVAFDREDGEELWSSPLSFPPDGALTLVDEPARALVPIGEAGLVAVDADGGEEAWTDDTIAPRTPVRTGDRLVFTGYRSDGDTGVLRSVGVEDGERQWAVDLDHPDTPPVLAENGIVVADSGTLALHDPADGTRLQELGSFGDRIPAMPAVADGTAYLGIEGSELLAVSLSDGTVEWRVDAGVTGDAAIAVGENAVVAAVESLPEATGAGVVALDRDGGDVLWEYEIGGFDPTPTTPPVLADGAVFFASNASSGVVALGDLPPADEG